MDDSSDNSGNQDGSADDEFARAMADVAPLKQVPRHGSVADKPNRESQIARDNRRAAALGLRDQADPNPLTLGEVPTVEPLAVLEWKKDGVQQAVFGKLRAGHYAADAELDLHGLTVKEARLALFAFVSRSHALDHRSLLIAHGRGEHSATPARLKSYLAHWLQELPVVIAFHSAQPHQGGTGAVYVLLKKSKRKKEETRETFGQKDDFERAP